MLVISREDIKQNDRIILTTDIDSEEAWRFEYTALVDGHMWEHYVKSDAKIYLKKREVKLPTKTYSMVVPPRDQAHRHTAYILEPENTGTRWYRVGSNETVKMDVLKDRLESGEWYIIEGPDA